MKAAVIGAGGLGSYVAATLVRAGHDVSLVVRGAHGDAVRDRGIRVDAPDGSFVAHPACVEPNGGLGAVDVAFVAVKAYSLGEVSERLAALAAEGAVVVPLLNGVDVSKRLVASGVAPDALVDGVAYLTAFRTGPGRIERKGEHQRLIVGSSTGAAPQAIERVRALFEETPVEIEIADDIRVALWQKMAVVCSLAMICGMTGSALGPIRAHPFGASLQRRAIAEVLAVGRATGVPLPADVEARVGATLDGFPGDFYPSVLHDLRSGRRTEMDDLAGVVARTGRAHGAEAPLAEAATCVVALVEDEAGRKKSDPG
ncbi:MAG: ketopantoate reductase family protein [Gemmatimonadota bacterium]